MPSTLEERQDLTPEVFKATRARSISSWDHIRPVELVLESKRIGGAAIFPCRISRRRTEMSIAKMSATSCVVIFELAIFSL